MLKRLMFLSWGFALCLGIMGCESNKPAQVPDDTAPPPETAPASNQDMQAPSAPG